MKRSGFFQQIAAGAVGAVLLQKQALGALFETGIMDNLFYIGSYTSTPQEGISICRFDPDNGTVQLVETCQGVENPSFLIFNRQRNFLYCVIETDNFGGNNSGAVSAFRCDPETGKLTFLNSMPSLGAHPCHLTIDHTEKFILVANYTGGNVAVLPILPNGQLGQPTDMVQHTGQGPNPHRQVSAHAHSVNLSPDNRFAFVCDLGIDKIMIYRFDAVLGKLTPADTPFCATKPGAGPRHFCFSGDGSQAFVVNELNSTLTSFKYDSTTGVLTEEHTWSTLPEGFIAENTCADLHCHPNGKFIYASNRGHNSIAVFTIENEPTHLKLIQNQSALGKTPRNFTIHSSGKYLLVANEDSGTIQTFTIDPESGKLAETGKFISVTKPVCLLF